MAEEEEQLEEAEENAADSDGEAEGGGDIDPLAEEMLKAMSEGEGEDNISQGDIDQMMEMEMLKAMEEDGAGGGKAASGGAAVAGGIPPNIARLMDVRLMVTIELGRTKKTIQDVLDLGEQSLIELDKAVGEPVDVLVNGKLFARGEVVTVSENFGVRITELVAPLPRL